MSKKQYDSSSIPSISELALDVSSPKQLTSEEKNLSRVPRHKPGELFLKGPVPLDWIERCLGAGHKAANVAFTLWFKANMNDCSTVRLTDQLLKRFCVTAETGRNVLKKMEEVGLVSVDRKRGRGPDVTILDHHLLKV